MIRARIEEVSGPEDKSPRLMGYVTFGAHPILDPNIPTFLWIAGSPYVIAGYRWDVTVSSLPHAQNEATLWLGVQKVGPTIVKAPAQVLGELDKMPILQRRQ